MTKAIPLKDFVRLTGLPSSLVIELLSSNKLPHQDSDSGILIPIDEQSLKGTLAAITEANSGSDDSDDEVLIERLGAIISDKVDMLLSEAMSELETLQKRD